jgi:hypothetical protein
MSLGFLIRLFLCIFLFGIYLYLYVDKQNQLTEIRLDIPPLTKEVRAIREEIAKLQYEVDQFESPAHLIGLAQNPEFGHLKHPLIKEILIVEENEINKSGLE